MTTTTHPQKKRVEKISFLIIGTLLYSLYISLLLSPNDIGSGGIMGITLVVQELFHTPIGLTQLLLNIPLFILGFRFLRKRFMFLSKHHRHCFFFFNRLDSDSNRSRIFK
ncbi:YitT family protein [Exiguobacterium sp. SL14]|nr:YitT family protein [Exiguobacterium sp. SL14]MCY1692208.1 YitT family protein [Exiguobacterium sp. SL14]